MAILAEPARQTLLAALAEARADGALIAFDPNYRPRLWPDAERRRAPPIGEALAVADIALPTFPDEHTLFGDASPRVAAMRIARLGVGEVVVKNGEEPALVWTDGVRDIVPPSTSPRPSTRRARAIPSTAPISRRGLPAPARPRRAQAAHRVAAAVVQVRGALAPFDVLREAFNEASDGTQVPNQATRRAMAQLEKREG